MKTKDAIALVLKGVEHRADAQDDQITHLRKDVSDIKQRGENTELLVKDAYNTLGAIALELREIRSALFRQNVVSVAANRRCDDAWIGIETPWPISLGTAQTETPAQQRATERESPLAKREQNMSG